MRVFKGRAFADWAAAVGLADSALLAAVRELSTGLGVISLGGGLCKKRVALAGRGKRGGGRVLLAYQAGSRAVFLYGLSKNDRDNVRPRELAALRRYTGVLLGYSEAEIDRAVGSGLLVEVTTGEQEHS